jgi:hypothetical protein
MPMRIFSLLTITALVSSALISLPTITHAGAVNDTDLAFIKPAVLYPDKVVRPARKPKQVINKSVQPKKTNQKKDLNNLNKSIAQ